jgi:hypothetical protein
MKCAKCKFYAAAEEECRRRAPLLPERQLEFYKCNMLRDIAVSLRKLASLPSRGQKEGDCDDYLVIDAYDFANAGLGWPHVEEYQWCGEFELRSD